MYKRCTPRLHGACLLVLSAALLPWSSPVTAAPAVLASILPLHSLSAAVMRGVAKPELLVPPGASPHAFALRPSDMHKLYAADLVVWIGGPLEQFLAKPLDLERASALLTISELADIQLFDARANDHWLTVEHASVASTHMIDPHLWLDPDNARTIVAAIAKRLARIDPPNAERYRTNAERTLRRLDELDAKLRRQLAPIAVIHYVVFLDAYQYFEAHYGLHAADAITRNPEVSPGASSIIRIRDRIGAEDLSCVFREPQFPPDLVHTIIEDTSARMGVLDPEGADIRPGPDAYFILMKRLGTALVSCLGRH